MKTESVANTVAHKKSEMRYLVMDVDGTLTDGKIYMGISGEMMKAFDIKDGYGIHDITPMHGITPIIITGRKSDIVTNRCKELQINEVYQGVSDKAQKLSEIIQDISKVAYIGDDKNDMPVMRMVKEAGGIIGCPRNAVIDVLNIADFVASHNGGDGAVRDFIEWLIDEKAIL